MQHGVTQLSCSFCFNVWQASQHIQGNMSLHAFCCGARQDLINAEGGCCIISHISAAAHDSQ